MAKEDVEKAVKEKGEETLPPAGYERDEALKIRQDNLDEEAERLAEQMFLGAIPEKYKEIDYEIAQRLDGLEVENRQEGYEYCC